MEDIEPINLGLGDQPREFETDQFHLLIKAVPYPYSYPDFLDLMTYPFWVWSDDTTFGSTIRPYYWLLPKKCYFTPLIHYVLSTFV